MDSLKFIETMSVADFKTKMEVERIDVKQNPHTGKCFFVYGCETGAVSDSAKGTSQSLSFHKFVLLKQGICSTCFINKGTVEHLHWQLCDIRVACLTWAVG